MIQKVVNLDKESHLVNGKIVFQIKKYIEEMEYNSLLDWKMEKLLKNKAK